MDSKSEAPSIAVDSRRQSWTYNDIAAVPPSGLEDHLVGALQKLTCRLDIAGVSEGVEAVFGATSSWIMLCDEHWKAHRKCAAVPTKHGSTSEDSQ